MTPAEWVLLVGSAGTFMAGAAAWVRSRADRRSGLTGDERADRRDTIADRDALIDQLQEQTSALSTRVERLELAREADAEWAAALVAHIWARKPPPPPARRTV